MIRILPYSKEYKHNVISIFKSNVPAFFDESEEVGFIKYLDEEIEDYFVVIDNDIIIGAGGVNYFLDERTASMSWAMITPDYHGKGIGKELTLYRIDHIRKSSNTIDTIVVRTSQFTTKFYEKMGFTTQEIIKDYWAKGFDLYLMKMNTVR